MNAVANPLGANAERVENCSWPLLTRRLSSVRYRLPIQRLCLCKAGRKLACPRVCPLVAHQPQCHDLAREAELHELWVILRHLKYAVERLLHDVGIVAPRDTQDEPDADIREARSCVFQVFAQAYPLPSLVLEADAQLDPSDSLSRCIITQIKKQLSKAVRLSCRMTIEHGLLHHRDLRVAFTKYWSGLDDERCLIKRRPLDATEESFVLLTRLVHL
mmetsp:Transcript_4648/g.12284  ORF Transcript_4648/g.12284 Transcript_4648/m.12284 type:complete len:217 (+) Transcript_4648:766-1416(+)